MDKLVELLTFYKNKIETDSLTSEEQLILSEFFIKHKLLKENKQLPQKFNDKDLLKYAFLGYYIYPQIDQNLQL